MSYEQYQQYPSQQTNIIVVNNKSTALAYILWFFFGGIGGHRFYLSSPIMGIAQMSLFLVGSVTSFIGIGFFFLVPLWLWLLFDLLWIAARMGHIRNQELLHITGKLNK